MKKSIRDFKDLKGFLNLQFGEVKPEEFIKDLKDLKGFWGALLEFVFRIII